MIRVLADSVPGEGSLSGSGRSLVWQLFGGSDLTAEQPSVSLRPPHHHQEADAGMQLDTQELYWAGRL